MDKRSWERIKRLVPKGYSRQIQYASKRKKKGRAMNEVVVGARGRESWGRASWGEKRKKTKQRLAKKRWK